MNTPQPALFEQKWADMRKASQGADISLLCDCGKFTAYFTCADKLAKLQIKGTLTDMLDGILDSIPIFEIPLIQMNQSLRDISETCSVALLDVLPSTQVTRAQFICFHVVPRRVKAVVAQQDYSSLLD